MKLLLTNMDEAEVVQEELDRLATWKAAAMTRGEAELQVIIQFRIDWLKLRLALYERHLDIEEHPYLLMDVLELFSDTYSVVYELSQVMDKLARENLASETYYDNIECDELAGIDVSKDAEGHYTLWGITLKGERYSCGDTDTNQRFFSFEQMADPDWLPKLVTAQKERLEHEAQRKAKAAADQSARDQAARRATYERLKKEFEKGDTDGSDSERP